MKRIAAILLLLCMVFLLCACPGGGPVTPPSDCTYCGGEGCDKCNPKPPAEGITVSPEDADYSIVFGAGAALDETGDSIADRSFVMTERTYDESSAISKFATRFFNQISFDGKVYKADGSAAAPLKSNNETFGHASKLTVLILPNGMTVSDSTSITLKNLIIVGDVTVESGNGVIFENVQFHGKITVEGDAKDTVFHSCRFSSMENKGEDTFVINSYIPFTGLGIESSGTGLYISNCRFEGTGTAISSSGDELEMRLCTVKADKDGIGVEIKDSENSLVALSVITGAQKSIVLDGAYNTAVVRNSLISVEAKANKNIYICDNAMGGRIQSENNNYFLADGNTYPEDGKDHRAVVSGNENVNGDTLTDVNARADVGANEELLPHVNKDLFVGMERKSSVKEYGVSEASPVYTYILEQARKSKYVLLAPGVYTTDITANFRADHSDTIVYAYGAYVEAVKSFTRNHMNFEYVENVAFKGLSIGYALQASGQVYVLKKLGNNQVSVITGAGMINAFSNSGSSYFKTTSIYLHRDGLFLGEYSITGAKNNSDGTMTVTLPSATLYDLIQQGDVMTCRLGFGSHSLQMNNSGNISFTDVTTYGYSGGFMFNERFNTSAFHYLRVCNTARSGEIIDPTTYGKYRDLETELGINLDISTDTLADGKTRYRGSTYLVGSQDALHTSRNVQGSQVTSCIFENICDDGTNQGAFYARLSEIVDNGDGTATIIYKAALSEYLYYYYGKDATINVLCADFRKNDRVYIYTSAGQLVCDAKALSDGKYLDTIPSTCSKVKAQDIPRYAVKVSKDKINMDVLEGYSLIDDNPEPTHKVLVDNMSRSSANACFDNTLIQNGHTNGMRFKAPDGVVKNCTFRNVAKTSVSLVYEIWWGESGVAQNFTLQNCIIDRTGYAPEAPAIDSTSSSYKFTPICIMGLGGSSLEANNLLFSDIRILDNKFVNRVLDHYNYAIYARAASNLTIKGNDFGTAEDEDGLFKYAGVLYLNGAANVELSGNTYSPYIDGSTELYVFGDLYKNIYGTDLGDTILEKLN